MGRHLSIHVVFDPAARRFWLEDAQTMPTDSRRPVWDQEAAEWQALTDADVDAYLTACGALAWFFDGDLDPLLDGEVEQVDLDA